MGGLGPGGRVNANALSAALAIGAESGEYDRSFFQITGTIGLKPGLGRSPKAKTFGGVLDSTLGWSVWLPFASVGLAL